MFLFLFFYFCVTVDVQVVDYTYNLQLEGECWSYVFCSPYLFLVILDLVLSMIDFLLGSYCYFDLCKLLFIYYGGGRSYAYPSMIFWTVYGVIIYEALVSAVGMVALIRMKNGTLVGSWMFLKFCQLLFLWQNVFLYKCFWVTGLYSGVWMLWVGIPHSYPDESPTLNFVGDIYHPSIE